LKLAYTHPNLAIVTQAASALERAGITAEIRNEYAAGGIGELAPIEAWPELWVPDRDWELAQRLIEADRTRAEGPEWQCGQCEASNPATFDWCWRCGADSALAAKEP